MRRTSGLVATVAVAASVGGVTAADAPAPAPPTVIAVMSEAGINVAHDNFQVDDPTPLPDGIRATPITIDFGADTLTGRLASATIVRELPADELFRIEGTNLVVVAPTARRLPTPVDLLADAEHGTWVADAAIGRHVGTAPPDTLLVMVLGIGPEGWQWAADQPWIAVATASAGELFIDCPAGEVEPINQMVEAGTIVFAANGNYDLGATTYPATPFSLPGVYQVGATDAAGFPWNPTSEPDPQTSPHGLLPTARLYETGDRYRLEAATDDSVDQVEVTHGTSFASPATAGRAATLISHAKRLLGDRQLGRPHGAVASGDGTLPGRGPLADGRFTVDELTDLLHHAAIPALSPLPGPARFGVEGYGALNTGAIDTALEVLAGTAELPPRDDEDQAYVAADLARSNVYQPAACG